MDRLQLEKHYKEICDCIIENLSHKWNYDEWLATMKEEYPIEQWDENVRKHLYCIDLIGSIDAE